MISNELSGFVRNIKDFPKQGIMFRDITTLLKEPKALNKTLELLIEKAENAAPTKVAGIESRGFIFGGMLANRLKVGFIPIRKPGKLPAKTISQTYELEYGTDKLEIHEDAVQPGDRILIHDDLLATGGTALAACNLIEKLGGIVVQNSFIIELSFLNGRSKLRSYDVVSLINYSSEE
jgi:adenine phosphoribosyltransferase